MLAVDRFVSPRGYAYPDDFAPEDESGYVLPLEGLAARSASLILGEPGAGKSTALSQLALALQTDSTTAHLLDLRDCYSEQSLEAAFDRVWGAPAPEQSVRILLLDSVDETRVLIRHFVRFLERRLGELVRAGWRVIAACRTAESVRALDELFEALDSGAVHVLLPLRRSDVEDIARSLGLDHDVFMQQVDRRRLQSLAATPLSLGLLFQIFTSDGSFPDSRRGVFERAISLMTAQDAVDGYSPAPHEFSFPLRQRVALERLAGFASFADATSFALFNVGEASAGSQTERLVGSERSDGATFEISNQDLQGALRTPLFGDRGYNERQFAHRQLKDFLAANHLHRAELPESQLRSILTVPDGTLVPPQMADVATWLVAHRPEQYRWLLDEDPLTLVRNRLTEDLPDLAREMVARLIARAEEVDRALSWRDELSGLRYPEMPRDFEAFLSGATSTQAVALRILRDSYMPGVEAVLTRLLHDTTLDIRIRELAADVARTHNVQEVLLHVDLGEPSFFAEDSDQQLRGVLLSAMWPDFLTPTQLVSHLVRPRDHFVGSYYMFLSRLADQITPELAAAVLDVGSVEADLDALDEDGEDADEDLSSLGRLVNAALALTLSGPEPSGSTLLAAGKVLAGILTRGRQQLPFSRSNVPIDRFQRLTAYLVEQRSTTYPLWFALLTSRDADDSPVLSGADVDWLARCAIAASGDELDAWLDLIDRLLDSSSDADMAWAWKQRHTPLWARLHARFDPVKLDSEDAARARETWARLKKLEDKSRDSGMPTADYVASIRRIMDEVRMHPTRFWFLARWLDVDLQTRRYTHEAGLDLLSSDNIPLLDENDREAILDLAHAYIRSLVTPERPFPMRLGRNKFYWGLYVAYKALHTLLVHRPRALECLSEAEWNIANMAILEAHIGNADADARAIRRELLKRSASVSRTNLTRAVESFIGRTVRETTLAGAISDIDMFVDSGSVPALRRAIRSGQSHRAGLCDLYLRMDPDGAMPWIRKRVLRSVDETEISTLLGSLAAAAPGPGYELLEEFLTARGEIARPILLQIAERERFANDRIREVEPVRRVAIYSRLAELFPPAGESFSSGVHSITPREDLARWRSDLLHSVANGGTLEGLQALVAAARETGSTELEYAVIAARESYRVNGWSSLSAPEYALLTQDRSLRLARSNDDVLGAVLESLDELQRWLRGETPQAFALWNVGPQFRNPKDENQISDWYCHSLRLILGAGLIVNREVEVSNALGRGVGDRQDIRVEVRDPSTGEHFVVVIEVKGIWNRDVRTSLVSQLADRYLARGGLTHGIFLVIDFDSSEMTTRSRAQQSDRNRRGLVALLNSQAAGLGPRLKVQPVIHDGSLPGHSSPSDSP